MFQSHIAPNGLDKVLDAGCGYKLPIDIPREAYLCGIDISPAAIDKNPNADELILGDIQSYPLPRNEFDAVICWWVLEHVPRPADALVNMSSTLKPGGLLVLGVPHVYSMKALVTKFTPYWFHVWVVKHFFGIPDAGQPGVEPYRTYLRWDLAPARVQKLLSQHSLRLVYSVTHPSNAAGNLPPALRAAWNAVARVMGFLTLGRWDPHADEYVALFQKQPADT